MEYYLDCETTSIRYKPNGTLDFDKMKILTIQYCKLNDGTLVSDLKILKSWESLEDNILQEIYFLLSCNKFNALLVGVNTSSFDLPLIKNRMKKLLDIDLDITDRIVIDLVSTLIIMNNGQLKGWNKIIPSTNTIINKDIPELYINKEYEKIESYIKCEFKDFIFAYKILKNVLPKIKFL